MTGTPDDGSRLGALRSAVAPVDGTLLKRVGVATYFGVYALIAIGGWRWLVEASQQVPPVVRPPAFAPLHVLVGLPRSFAWGLTSLSITALVVTGVAAIQIRRERRDRRGVHDGSDRSLGKGLVSHGGTRSGSRRRRLRATVAGAGRSLRGAGRSLRERLPGGTGGERQSLRERSRTPSLPDVRRPSRPDFGAWRARLPRPDTSRLRGRVPMPSAFLRRGDEAAVRLHDDSLPVPTEPLSLPREPVGTGEQREDVEAREWEVSRGTGTAYAVEATAGADTADGAVVESAVEAVGGSEVAVTGGPEPSPDAPWPADTADDGSEAEVDDEPDASAPWPDGWRSGDEL